MYKINKRTIKNADIMSVDEFIENGKVKAIVNLKIDESTNTKISILLGGKNLKRFLIQANVQYLDMIKKYKVNVTLKKPSQKKLSIYYTAKSFEIYEQVL